MSDYKRLKNFAYLMKVGLQLSTLFFLIAIGTILLAFTVAEVEIVQIIGMIFFTLIALAGVNVFYKAFNTHQKIASENIDQLNKDREI